MVLETSLIFRFFVNIEFFIIIIGFFFVFFSHIHPELMQDIREIILLDSKKKDKHSKYPHLPSNLPLEGKVKVYGKEINDPFPSLENLTSKETKDWVKAQEELTDLHHQKDLGSLKNAFLNKFLQHSAFESIKNPINLGGYYFFYKKIRPELPQFSLFCTKDLHSEAKLVFDPNTLIVPTLSKDSKDLTDTMPIVHGTWISSDGMKLVYGYSQDFDSNNMTLRVKDIILGKELAEDIILDCKVDYTNVAWLESRTGFFYTKQVMVNKSEVDEDLTVKEYSNRILYHKLGASDESDLMIFETITNSNDLVINIRCTYDMHYLLVDIFKRKREANQGSCYRAQIQDNCGLSELGNKVYYYDLTKFDGLYVESLGPCIKLIDTFHFIFDYISNIEEDFWFRTNYNAPNFRVVRITLPDTFSSDEFDNDINQTKEFKNLQAWKACLDWIPQRIDGDLLESASIAAHTVLVLKYLKNGTHDVLLYDLTQNLVERSQIPVADLPHPPHATIEGPDCNFYSSEIFYQHTSLSDPSSIFRAVIHRDPFNGSIEISFHQVNSTDIPGLNKNDFDSDVEFVETQRNVFVPVTKFGLREIVDENDQPRPCLVYINSSFGLTATPVFSLPLLLFAKYSQGLIFIVNTQGSGIYGKPWHDNGKKTNKFNSVVDLEQILRFIIKKGYSTPSQIALVGGGFNGLTLSSAVNRFPDLFKVAVIENGLFDLVKYQEYNRPVIFMETKDRLVHSIVIQANNAWKSSLWFEELGCILESESECDRLVALSPLHSIDSKLKTTPAILLIIDTLTKSETVSPIHSLKYIASLQKKAQESFSTNHSIFLYVKDQQQPDSTPSSRSKLFLADHPDNIAFSFAFILHHINAPFPNS